MTRVRKDKNVQCLGCGNLCYSISRKYCAKCLHKCKTKGKASGYNRRKRLKETQTKTLKEG